MMHLTLTFDGVLVDAAEIAEIEERVWDGLKLSGEFNRSLNDGQWVIQFIIEKKVKEEAVRKIAGVEKARTVSLRDQAEENTRSRRKTALVTADDLEDEEEEPPEEDE